MANVTLNISVKVITPSHPWVSHSWVSLVNNAGLRPAVFVWMFAFINSIIKKIKFNGKFKKENKKKQSNISWLRFYSPLLFLPNTCILILLKEMCVTIKECVYLQSQVRKMASYSVLLQMISLMIVQTKETEESL